MLKRLIIVLFVTAYLIFAPYRIAHHFYADKGEGAFTYYLIGLAMTVAAIIAVFLGYIILYTIIHWIIWGHTELMDFEISSLFKH